MKKIKELNFGFENCEIIRFNNDDIAIFIIDNIYTTIQKLRNDWVQEFKIADNVFIVLKPHANIKQKNIFLKDEMPFTRINMYNDITSIGITYLDGEQESHEEYYPTYVNATYNGEENKRQFSMITNRGYLIIVINKKVEENYDGVKEDIKEYYWLFDDTNDMNNK